MAENRTNDSNREFAQKVNTKGKYLKKEMQDLLTQAVERHMGFLILIAKEQARRYGISEDYINGRPNGWFADLVNAGIYGMCRGALAWQQKEIEGLRTTNFDGEVKQAARVRVKHMAKRINRFNIMSGL